jgi:hypothetical protein
MIAPDAKTGALIFSSLVAVPQEELSNSLENNLSELWGTPGVSSDELL